jgi:TrwC relaxase
MPDQPRQFLMVLAETKRIPAAAGQAGYRAGAALVMGEPDGRWFGNGAEALGLRDGLVMRREAYLAVHEMTDPRTGERLHGMGAGRLSEVRGHPDPEARGGAACDG